MSYFIILLLSIADYATTYFAIANGAREGNIFLAWAIHDPLLFFIMRIILIPYAVYFLARLFKLENWYLVPLYVMWIFAISVNIANGI